MEAVGICVEIIKLGNTACPNEPRIPIVTVGTAEWALHSVVTIRVAAITVTTVGRQVSRF